jgi:hypothetical protein
MKALLSSHFFRDKLVSVIDAFSAQLEELCPQLFAFDFLACSPFV